MARGKLHAIRAEGLQVAYNQFDADGGGMILLAAPGVYEFFDAHLEQARSQEGKS